MALQLQGDTKGGEDGSPLIMLKSVINCGQILKECNCTVDFLFVEEDGEKVELLRQEIRQMPGLRDYSFLGKIVIEEGNCEEELLKIIGSGKYKTPAFVFLDQFGYKHVPMSLVNKLMEPSMAETFIYINYQRMHPYLTDPTKQISLNSAFGDTSWEKALEASATAAKRKALEKAYRMALQSNGNVSYPWFFSMKDKRGLLINWLFFCTNSLKGLEEMKKAMIRVDPTKDYSFSDRDGLDQLTLDFPTISDEDIADEIVELFDGEKISTEVLCEYTLTETPSCNWKGAIQTLKKRGELKEVDPEEKKQNIFYQVIIKKNRTRKKQPTFDF